MDIFPSSQAAALMTGDDRRAGGPEHPAGHCQETSPFEEMAARLDALLGARLSKLHLPPDIMAQFKASTARSGQKMMTSWCSWIAGVNLACGLFDLGETAGSIRMFTIEARAMIAVIFLVAAQFCARNAAGGRNQVLVIAACLITVLIGNLAALNTHSNDLSLIYMTMSVVVVYTAIMFLPLDMQPAMLMAGGTLVQVGGFLMLFPLPSLAEKLQMMVFLSGVMGALLQARRIQNLYQYRVFLLQRRDELRASEITRLNQELTSIAYTDRLTGIPNRRYFDEKMADLTADPAPFLPVALCLIDIDHFKNLNDRQGHQQGDRCLQMVARAMQSSLRGRTDLLARYGGEEFVLVLRNTNFETAVQLMERLRLAVRHLNLPNPGSAHGCVTISAGTAATGLGAFDADLLVRQADAALYRAKSAGRDQVCV